MLNLLITSIPIIISIFYFIYMISKKNKIKSIQSKLLGGFNCYECKCEINDVILNNIDLITDNNEKLALCKSCNRDLKIDKLKNDIKIDKLKNYRIRIFNKIKLSIISKKKFIKISLILFGIIFLLFILNILSPKGVHIFNYLFNLFLTFYWVIIIYRNKLIYIKKTDIKSVFEV